jgi:hypothetical protein
VKTRKCSAVGVLRGQRQRALTHQIGLVEQSQVEAELPPAAHDEVALIAPGICLAIEIVQRLADGGGVAHRVDAKVRRHEIEVDQQAPGKVRIARLAHLERVANGQVEHVAVILLEVQQGVDALLIVVQHPPRLAQASGKLPALGIQGQGAVGVALAEAIGLAVQLAQLRPLHVAGAMGFPLELVEPVPDRAHWDTPRKMLTAEC